MTRVKHLLLMFFLLGATVLPFHEVSASSAEGKNPLLEHVKNSHEWHFATVGHHHITLPLPVIIYKADHGVDAFLSSRFVDASHHHVSYKGYELNNSGKIIALDGSTICDISITRDIAGMILSVVILLLIFLSAGRYYANRTDRAPKGFFAFLEMIILFIRDDVANPAIGAKHALRFMPYLLTVFFFIWLNNLLGLLPGAANVTGNISITLTLALFTFFITNFNGNKHYWAHVFAPPVPKWLYPLMIPLEVISLFVKPFSLMIRLFANITAGHIVMLSVIGIIFIFGSLSASVISVPFGVFMFFIKLGVSFLQAYVFTLLSALYFGNAVDEAH